MNLQDIIKAHEEISYLIKSGCWDEVIGSKGCDLDAILAHDHRDFLIKLVREMKPYVELSKWIFQQCVVDGGDICGGDMQDKMLEMNLLNIEHYSQAKHADIVSAEFGDGDQVYFFNQDLLDRLEEK